MSDIDNIIRNSSLFLIVGPCVIESEELCNIVADKLKSLSTRFNIPAIFKSSYLKANRTSGSSFSGPGLDEGLKILASIKEKFDLPVLTDIHETTEIDAVADAVDVMQIPAFLCRQTKLIKKAAATGKWINIKKGQFMAPDDMEQAANKAESDKVMITERGSAFGYHNLVVDFRSLLIMRKFGYPIVFDATHSLQLPSVAGSHSSGQPEFIVPFARAAAAIGVNGLFAEAHPDPSRALSDAGAMLPLDKLETLIQNIIDINDRNIIE